MVVFNAPKPVTIARKAPMHQALRSRFVLCAAVMAGIALPVMSASAQQPYGPNDAPNVYKFNYGWAQLPDRRKFGASLGP